MKLLFVGQNHLDTLLWYEVAQQLALAGIPSATVTYLRYAYELRPEQCEVFFFKDFTPKRDFRAIQQQLDEEVASLEQQINPCLLDTLVLSDKSYSPVIGLPRYRDARNGRAQAALQVKAWRKILSQVEPTHIFTLADGCLLFRTLFCAANSLSTPTYMAAYAPFPGRMFWIPNEKYKLTNMACLPLSDYTAEEQDEMRSYLQQFRESRIQIQRTRHRDISSKLRQLFEYLWIKVRFERESESWLPLRWSKEFLVRAWRRRLEPNLYQAVSPDEPYIFFPMHDPLDSQITVRAPQYMDQIDFIEHELIPALPGEVKLYLKPHPMQIGAYPHRALKRLARHPRVRLIEPTTPAHHLIRHSVAIVTINSTTGYEGILFGKPVVVLADPFYAGHGFTYDVKNPSDLKSVLKEAVEAQTVAYSEQELLRFLLNLQSESIIGDVSFYLTRQNEFVLPSSFQAVLHKSGIIPQFTDSILKGLAKSDGNKNRSHPISGHHELDSL